MHDHPWASAHQHFQDHTAPLLAQHGLAIGAAARAGDEWAQDIMARTVLLHRSFDPMTAHLLDQALARWLPSQAGSA